MSRTHPFLAHLALGLMALTGIASADDGGPIRAWVEFNEQGSTVTITGHAWSPQPVNARYTLTIESVSDAGITRSRDSSRTLLHAEPVTLTRIAIATTDPRRIEVTLEVAPDGAEPLQVHQIYPMSGAWVMAR